MDIFKKNESYGMEWIIVECECKWAIENALHAYSEWNEAINRIGAVNRSCTCDGETGKM